MHFPFITVKEKEAACPGRKGRHPFVLFSERTVLSLIPRVGQSSAAKDPGWVQEEQATVAKKLLLNQETLSGMPMTNPDVLLPFL